MRPCCARRSSSVSPSATVLSLFAWASRACCSLSSMMTGCCAASRAAFRLSVATWEVRAMWIPKRAAHESALRFRRQTHQLDISLADVALGRQAPDLLQALVPQSRRRPKGGIAVRQDTLPGQVRRFQGPLYPKQRGQVDVQESRRPGEPGAFMEERPCGTHHGLVLRHENGAAVLEYRRGTSSPQAVYRREGIDVVVARDVSHVG